MWLALLQGFSLATAPLFSFGPFKIFVLSSALDNGWRKSLPLALTPLIGDFPVIILIWLVLQQFPEWSVNVLRIVGSLFYVYLAISLIKKQQSFDPEAIENAPQRSFIQAITAIWISPGIYLHWSTIGVPVLLGYTEKSTWHGVAFLLGFYILWVSGLAGQIIVAGQTGKVTAGATRYVIIAASLVLVGFALLQFWTGVSGLLALAN